MYMSVMTRPHLHLARPVFATGGPHNIDEKTKDEPEQVQEKSQEEDLEEEDPTDANDPEVEPPADEENFTTPAKPHTVHVLEISSEDEEDEQGLETKPPTKKPAAATRNKKEDMPANIKEEQSKGAQTSKPEEMPEAFEDEDLHCDAAKD